MENLLNQKEWNQIAEIELVYKSQIKASERPKVVTSKDCYKLLRRTWDDGKIDLLEQFKILLLNRRNRVLGIYEVSTGGMTGTVADVRLIFTAALKAGSCAIVLCHNHPSGNLKPSKADEELTYKIREAARFFDIKVIDHIIVSHDGYFSFADEGML